MAPKNAEVEKVEAKTGGFLFAVAVGFLVNLLLGAALPEIGPFVAGLVSGILVKKTPLQGGIAGFLAGTLGGLASLAFWLTTNIFGLPTSLITFSFETAIFILTVEYAALSLSGGIIGSALTSNRFPSIVSFIKHRKLSLPGLPSAAVDIEKRED